MGGFGRLIGAIVGGVLGYLIPGVGFAIGFAIGGLIGGLVDPGGQVKSPGVPRQQLQITTNEIGSVIPDALGTVKITGIFLAYGKERSKKQYAKSSGGKGGMFGGGSKKQVTGYKYYMSWIQAICAGPVDTLYAIYKDNDTLIWEGELNRPVSGGKETITIRDLGTIDFYFGTTDHAQNTKIGTLIGDPKLNSTMRGLCYAHFDDCYIGTYNRCPSIHFVLKKCPAISSLPAGTIATYDYNPANAIWYILHTLSGLPETWLDTTDFIAFANTLATEQRGISILFDPQNSALAYLQAINSHVDAIIQYNADGKFHPKIIRNDYSVPALPSVDESVFLEEPTLSRASWIDTVNEIKVQYSEIVDVSRLATEGSLYTWGDDSAYQLGQGFSVPKSGGGDPLPFRVPTMVGGSYRWNGLPTGYGQVFVLEEDVPYGIGITPGTTGAPNPYYCFDPETATTIEQLNGTTFASVKSSSGGASCFGVVKSDGTLWMCGQNGSGQLGQGDTAVHAGWVQVGSDTDWAVIACGYAHAAGLKTDGKLYIWGHSDLGGADPTVPVQIPGIWGKVTCGYYYTLFLDAILGEMYCVGANAGGNLGIGGAGSVTVVTPTGMGVGTGIWMDLSGPLLVSLAIDSAGELYACGKLWGASDTPVYSFTNIGSGFVKCAGGLYCGFGIKEDGTLWAIGYNYNYALGLNDTTKRTSLTQVGVATDWIDVSGFYEFTYGIRGQG